MEGIAAGAALTTELEVLLFVVSRNVILPGGLFGPFLKPPQQSTIKAAHLAQQHLSGSELLMMQQAVSHVRC